MTETLYVNKPGGVVVHLEGGSSTPLKYGDPVPVDKLAHYVNPQAFADPTPRVSVADAGLEQARQAHARTALAEGGQVHSGSSAVPANYDDLDEDAAARLVQMLERYPEAQAQVLVHEILFAGNRQKVFDAASDYAKISANAHIAALTSKQMKTAADFEGASTITSLGDPEAGRTRYDVSVGEKDTQFDQRLAGLSESDLGGMAVPPSGSGVDLDQRESAQVEQTHPEPSAPEDQEWDAEKVNHDQITAYVEQHDLGAVVPGKDGGTKQERIDAIKGIEGHEKPATPIQ